MPAVKPKAGRKETSQDPESKKTKEVTKGLGHWRCSQCSKPCKVKVQMPSPKVEVPANNVVVLVVDSVPTIVESTIRQDSAWAEGNYTATKQEAPIENVATLPA